MNELDQLVKTFVSGVWRFDIKDYTDPFTTPEKVRDLAEFWVKGVGFSDELEQQFIEAVVSQRKKELDDLYFVINGEFRQSSN